MNEYQLLNAYRIYHEKLIYTGVHWSLAPMAAYSQFVKALVKILGPLEQWDKDTMFFVKEVLSEIDDGRHPFFTLGKLYKPKEAA